MVQKPSVSIPQWMLDEIEARRPKGSNRSEYIRESLERRFELEDADEWEHSTGEFELSSTEDTSTDTASCD